MTSGGMEGWPAGRTSACRFAIKRDDAPQSPPHVIHTERPGDTERTSITECAPSPSVRLLIHRRRRRARRRAGFWLAWWQGLISPITFVISLFNDEANIYEVNNNGNWYDLGFILGVAIVFSGPAGALAPSQGAHGPAARSPDALRTVHGHHRTPIHPPRMLTPPWSRLWLRSGHLITVAS